MLVGRAALALALAGLSLGGCFAQRADESPIAAPTSDSCPDDVLSATEVLECVSPSVALVETSVSGGSGILIEGGYVVTNAHVVEPFGKADLTFSGLDYHADVPVVGVDALADIAVLGPVDVDRPPLRLGSGVDIAQGHDVYLVGYPGEFEDFPKATISRGVLSRVRRAGGFGHQYLQTDASIGGGQSGGALVDERGGVIGISGLSFAEQFALALDGTDVGEAVDRILAEDGDAYEGLPTEEGSLVHTIELKDALDQQVLLAPAQPTDVTLRLEISEPEGVAIDVTDFVGEPLLVNDVALQRYADIDDIPPSSLGVNADAPVAPGVYEVELAAYIDTSVIVSIASGGPRTVTIRSSEPLVPLPARERAPVVIGETVDGVVGFLDDADIYEAELAEGDRLDLAARSPQGDMALYVLPPGGSLADLERFDDSGGGLYGLDAEGTVTAGTAGTYVILVATLDTLITGYRFSAESG